MRPSKNKLHSIRDSTITAMTSLILRADPEFDPFERKKKFEAQNLEI
jgi:hypothetical protein